MADVEQALIRAPTKAGVKPNLMVLQRDYNLGSKTGLSIAFRAGVPVHVPPRVVPEAVAIGAVMADGTDPGVLQGERKVVQAPSDPAERAKQIKAAFEIVIEKNDREDFSAAGTPTAVAVSREVGFRVPDKEVKQVWAMVREEKAAESATTEH